MYSIKNVAKRGSALLAAASLLAGIGASALPALASADALNPLTERSLTLSSSSPGWANTDGSGNDVYAPPNSGANGQKTGNYFSFRVSTNSALDADSSGAPDNPIKAMSFQYCDGSAGNCKAPGDNTPLTGDDDATHSDLNVHYPDTSGAEVDGTESTSTGTITLTSGDNEVVGSSTTFTSNLKVGGSFKTDGGNVYVVKSIRNDTDMFLTTDASATETGVHFKTSNFLQVVDPVSGLVKAVPGYTNNNPKYSHSGDPAEAAKNVGGYFIVMYKSGGTWTQSTGWTVSTSSQEETVNTGKQNTIILQNSTGLGLPAGTQMKVLFFATANDYITNPGEGAFYVKINTFKNFDALSATAPVNTLKDNLSKTPTDVIDGGVTVANVMNQSIQIQTKVLETMQFSVGTVDPDTLDSTQLANSAAGPRKPCNGILTGMTASGPQNVLSLGNQDQESSLSTDTTYATHSYWRLSSNSSAGATVYYSGHTLSNTSGDEITPIGVDKMSSSKGAEQFGLALDTTAVNGSTNVARLDDGDYGVDYSTAGTAENAADNTAAGVIAADAYATANGSPVSPLSGGVDDTVLTDLGATHSGSWDYSALDKSYHTPKLDPLAPTANYGSGDGAITDGGDAQFAFDPMSDTVPVPIADESSQVVDCVTGKMRYIANIAATTPAGIYTTKVNYIAAPQY